MVNPIPSSVRKIWSKWNIRGIILFSLSLQTVLIVVAPYRKSSRKKLVMMLIWSAYLLADWAANFAVGLISDSLGDEPDQSSQATDNSDLIGFWAPFLLLHLGGPDTITAFALEDNELWLRHLLGLVFQALAALYVFGQSLPKNKIWLPTLLMFLAGVIKYAERTRSLYLASLDRFRDSMLKEPDPGPNYAKLMEEYASKKDAQLPTRIINVPEPDKESKATDNTMKKGKLSDLEVVQYAYHYFKIFKGLVVDLIFSFHERNKSREFFENRDHHDALRVIEVELNFIYEVLFTKVEVVHSRWGYIFRFIASGSVAAALGLFRFRTKKHGFDRFDVWVTYTLLFGALALDVIAFVMLIFSDWTFAALLPDPETGPEKKSFPSEMKLYFADILSPFLVLRKPRWRCTNSCKHNVLASSVLFRRWSGSVSTYNLISYCLKARPSRIHTSKGWLRTYIGIVIEKVIWPIGVLLNLLAKVSTWMTIAMEKLTKLYTFISNVVSQYMTEHKSIYWLGFIIAIPIQFLGLIIWLVVFIISSIFGILRLIVGKIIDRLGVEEFLDEIRYLSSEPLTEELWRFIFKELKGKSQYADDIETAKMISSARGDWVLSDSVPEKDRKKLMAYLTGVKYDESLLLWHIATELCYNTDNVSDSDPSGNEADTDKTNRGNNANSEFSKHDYREFSKILSDYMLYLLVMQPTMMSAVAGIGIIRFRDTCAEAERFFKRKGPGFKEQKKACKIVLSINTDVKPVDVKGDRSKSVFFDASILAKELQTMEEEDKIKDKWELLSKIWVELLSHAASNCRANTHAQQLSKGGELITFVWLLMAHFGLGEQFQINEGHARAKLIVRK